MDQQKCKLISLQNHDDKFNKNTRFCGEKFTNNLFRPLHSIRYNEQITLEKFKILFLLLNDAYSLFL